MINKYAELFSSWGNRWRSVWTVFLIAPVSAFPVAGCTGLNAGDKMLIQDYALVSLKIAYSHLFRHKVLYIFAVFAVLLTLLFFLLASRINSLYKFSELLAAYYFVGLMAMAFTLIVYF